MSYLAIENARRGGIKKRLPRHYRDEFEEFINVLHIDYFYNGNYPANYEEEFEKWYRKVEEFAFLISLICIILAVAFMILTFACDCREITE